MKEIIVQVAAYSADYPKAPIYVADLVRCKECKWRKAKMMPKSVKCLFSGKADDFCSYGEREGE